MRYLWILLFLSACALLPSSLRDLDGLSADQVQSRLGTPLIKRTEDPYQVWVYRKDACSVLIYMGATQHVIFVDTSGECSSLKN